MFAKLKISNTILIILVCILTVTFQFFHFKILDISIHSILQSNDSLTYIDAVKSLLNGKGHPTRPIGFSILFIAPFILTSHPSESLLFIYTLILNFVCYAITAIFLWKLILKKTNNATYANLAFLTLLSLFGITTKIFYLYTELTILAIFTLSIYHAYNFAKCKNCNSLIWVLFLIWTSVYIRPGNIYLFYITIIYFFYHIIKNPKRQTHLYKNGALILIIPLSLTISQAYLMKTSFNSTKISYIDKLAWYLYLSVQLDSPELNLSVEELYNSRLKDVEVKTITEISNLADQNMKKRLLNDPISIIYQMLTNLKNNTIGGSSHFYKIRTSLERESYNVTYYEVLKKVTSIQNISIVLLTLLASVVIVINRPTKDEFFAILIFTSIIIISSVSFKQGDRFHIVVYPIGIYLVCCALMKFRGSKKLISV